MTKDFSEGDIVTTTHLEGCGWYEIYNFGYKCRVFAKDNRRIVIDLISHKITDIYAIQ